MTRKTVLKLNEIKQLSQKNFSIEHPDFSIPFFVLLSR